MKTKKWFYVLLLCLSITLTTKVWSQTLTNTITPTGQNWDCGLDQAMMNQLSSDTSFVNGFARYNNAIQNASGGNQVQAFGNYIVPVVFHVLSTTTSTVTLPYAQIKWQMARLNAAFQNQMLQFTGQTNGQHAVNTQIEFRLACVAQNSLSAWTSSLEPGVMRYAITNTLTSSAILNQGVLTPATNAPMLAVTHPTAFPNTFPPANYLNIWCVPNIVSSNGGTVIAYGTFPWMSAGIDGIVTRIDAIGNNSYPNNFSMIGQLDKGSVLAHEAGHYLGLLHTFETVQGGVISTAGGAVGCYPNPTFDGDMIYDTPPTFINQDLGSVTSVNSCQETYSPYTNGIPDADDQLENYMSYSDDDKHTTFTFNQSQRMISTFTTTGTTGRFNLNAPANLAATGIFPVNTCSNTTGILTGVFNYSMAPGSNCNSVTIQFTNPTSLGFSGVNYTWNFGDGTAVVTGTNPSHNYIAPLQNGYLVSCTVSNPTGTTTFTQVVSTKYVADIIGQSGTTVCRGSEQTIYIDFGAFVPSVILTTDGVNQITVFNNASLNTNHVVPYTFVANASASYSLYPASCYTSVATFSVIDCCNTLITNGDFNLGNTGFNTQLTTPFVSNPNYYGRYEITDPSTHYTGLLPGMHNITGDALFVDGFQDPFPNNPLLTVAVPSGCNQTVPKPIVWQQTVTLQPSTKYYYSFKISQNFNSTTACPTPSNTALLNFNTSIYNTTLTAITATLEPIRYLSPAYNNPSPYVDFVVYTYTFITSNTMAPNTTFSVEINQIKNFYGGGYDFVIDNIRLNQMSANIQAIGSNTICIGESTPLNALTNCAVNLTDYNVVWTPSVGLSNNTIINPIASPTTTTIYTLVATPTSTNGGVTSLTSVTITVNPARPTISLTTVNSCPSPGYTLTASGGVSYTWTPGSVVSNSIAVNQNFSGIYTVKTGPGVCDFNTFNVIPLNITCCSIGISADGALQPQTVHTGTFSLNQPLTVPNFTLSNAVVYMGTNAEVVIQNNGVLVIEDSHVLGCPTMWKGFRFVGPNGSVIIRQGAARYNTLIEDALIGIDLTKVTSPSTQTISAGKIIQSTDAVFNKNYTALAVANYSATTNYPAEIINNVFTSRKLITNEHQVVNSALVPTYNWKNQFAISGTPTSLKTFTPIATAAYSVITTPFNVNDQFNIIAGYGSAALEQPHTTTIGRNGITVESVANNTITAGFAIGTNTITQKTMASMNLFDNLNYGIYATNSNVFVSNTAFQYIQQYKISITDGCVGKGCPPAVVAYFGGIALYSINGNPEINGRAFQLKALPNTAPTSYNTSGNLFFNNATSIKVSNVQYATINNNIIHSKRIYGAPSVITSTLQTPMMLGQNGILYNSSDFRLVNIIKNYEVNLNTAIWFRADYTPYTDPATDVTFNAQKTGSVNIAQNKLAANYVAAVGTTGLDQGIVVDNILNQTTANTFTTTATDVIRVNNNNITNAISGIAVNNFKREPVYTYSNTITMVNSLPVPNLFLQNVSQYGIIHQNNTKDQIKGNNITGFSPSAKTNLYGIYARDNAREQITCNTTNNTYEGFTFAGAANLGQWKNNTMTNHTRGMHLNNTTIGTQGNATTPIQNVWNTGNINQTYVSAPTLTSTASYSKLYVRNVSAELPTINTAQNFGTGYLLNTSLIIATGTSGINCTAAPIANPNGNNGNANGNTGNGNGNGNNGNGNGNGGSVNVMDAGTIESLNTIVIDAVEYLDYDPTMKHYGKGIAHQLLKEDPNLMIGEPALQTFMATTSNYDAFENVEDAMAIGDVTNGKTLNATVVTQNSVEFANQQFFKLYANVKTNSVDANDVIELFALANDCPYTKGTAVYQARVLYNSIFDIQTAFEDNCITTSASRLSKTTNEQEIINSIYNPINVYPNPSNNTFYINLKEAGITDADLKVYDATGRLIYNKTTLAEVESLQLNAKGGLYFLIVTNNKTNVLYKQKLVLQN